MGPQQARLAAGLKKALAERDAVMVVTGPVGIGKSVSVQRALDSLTMDKSIVRIDRMPLSRAEVLEALLMEFGVDAAGQSTPQRFASFRARLNEHEAASKRVLIVVEDACRLGADGLAELESLTSADNSAGANLVVMGPPEFGDLLQTPELARLKQRIRLRQTLEPLSSAEVRGYLVHRLRAAGGDCNAVIAADAITALHGCSGGIPRVINGLCNSAMASCADRQHAPVTADDVRRVASEEFGYVDATPSSATESAPKSPIADNASNAFSNADLQEADAGDHAAPAGEAETAEPRNREPDSEPADLVIPDEIDIPDLIQDTLPRIKALKDPDAQPTPAEALEALRDKTHHTQPSLPVLDLGGDQAAERAAEVDAAVRGIAESLQEPRTPEPLRHETADTQTARALDSALRPDTQLLESLAEDVPVLTAESDPENGSPAASGKQPQHETGADVVPTLSDSMRLDTSATAGLRTPSIDALEVALGDAREGSQKALDTGSQPALVLKPEPAVSNAAASNTAETGSLPAITLDDDIERQKEEARARLAAEAEKAAAALAKIEKKPTAAELAKAREIDAEKKRLAGMATVAAQLDAGDELRLADTQTSAQQSAAAKAAPVAAPADEKPPQSRLEKLAAELGQATSLEEIDDVAAETLFGEEFSQLAATIAESAANDKQASGESASEPPVVEVAAQGGIATANAQATAPQTAAPASPGIATQNPGRSIAASQVQDATPTAAAPQPATPNAQRHVPPPGPMDTSAAKRLEMVRSLNKGKMPPPVNTMPGEEIILGSADDEPTHSGPAPEPIENQFGTSMTANLKALSETSMDAMRKAQAQTETGEKKGGLLSRFRRS